MNDYILSALAFNGTVRIYVADTTNMVEAARLTHKMFPTPCVALGRTLTAAALMSRTLKSETDTLTLQLKGDGPIKGIIVVSDSKCNVRGYVHNPHFNFPLNENGKFDIAGAIGHGYLNVIKDIGLKEPYIGYVELVSGEIAEDIAYYYASSEQTPTVFALGVLMKADGSVLNSGGYFIQLMPEATEETINFLEKNIEALPPITQMLSSSETTEDILKQIVGEHDYQILDRQDTQYKCNCSRDRMERNLISLGKKELLEIQQEQHQAELTCHFCNTSYMFNEDALGTLLKIFN